jgi:hypothetical protein
MVAFPSIPFSHRVLDGEGFDAPILKFKTNQGWITHQGRTLIQDDADHGGVSLDLWSGHPVLVYISHPHATVPSSSVYSYLYLLPMSCASSLSILSVTGYDALCASYVQNSFKLVNPYPEWPYLLISPIYHTLLSSRNQSLAYKSSYPTSSNLSPVQDKTTKSSKEVGKSYAVLMFEMVSIIKNMRERIRLGPLPRILEPHQYTVLFILLKLLKILSTPIQNLALLGPTSSIYCHPDITSLPMDLGNYTLPNCPTTFLQIPTELGQSPRLSCQYPYSQHHPF